MTATPISHQSTWTSWSRSTGEMGEGQLTVVTKDWQFVKSIATPTFIEREQSANHLACYDRTQALREARKLHGWVHLQTSDE
jgi:hypothetical protein